MAGLISVETDDSLKVIKEIFENARFHHLLVVNAEKLVGVISDRDLHKALNPNIGTVTETLRDKAVLNKKAHQIMTREPTTLPMDADLRAPLLILFEQIRA